MATLATRISATEMTSRVKPIRDEKRMSREAQSSARPEMIAYRMMLLGTNPILRVANSILMKIEVATVSAMAVVR